MSRDEVKNALRIARDTGGGIDTPKPKAPRFSGAIHSSVAGRTDNLPITLESGSYVFPADLVSGMGEGNTIAGFKHLKRMFGGTPYGGSSPTPYGQGKTPYGMNKGGVSSGVPIVAAGGEYVVHPNQVRDVGGGDLDTGHRVLDKFVLRMRKELIHTLKNLAPPKKD
jgi:hypothetical protein